MTTPNIRLSALVCLLFAQGAIGLAAPAQSEALQADSWRAAALKQYDQNRDGRLSDAEREVMRKEVFTERRHSSGRGRGMMFPPEIVAKYDTDGDGTLDETESRTAQQALMKMFQELQKKYDTNGNGNFEPAEVEKLQADAAAGKLEDVPKFLIQILGRQGRRPRANRPPSAESSSAEIDLRQMDKDGDGRLNEEELRAARAALENSRKLNDRTPPGSPR